jgi:hypothetical protein
MPRWLVVSMVSTSILTVIIACLGLWASLPDRTAVNFLDPIQEGRFEESNAVLLHANWMAPSPSSVRLEWRVEGGTYSRTTFAQLWQQGFRKPNLKFCPRSWSDRVFGRRTFHASIGAQKVAVFQAERGIIRFVEFREIDPAQTYEEFDLGAYSRQKGP